MRRTPRPTTYNAQKLDKELRSMSEQQISDPQWWRYLGPDWDHWTLDQLNELIDFIKD